MPSYRFTGGDSRDYFPASIGRVNPGDVRDFDEAPDANWEPVSPPAVPFPQLLIPPRTA